MYRRLLLNVTSLLLLAAFTELLITVRFVHFIRLKMTSSHNNALCLRMNIMLRGVER